jgi:hypothetical protein
MTVREEPVQEGKPVTETTAPQPLALEEIAVEGTFYGVKVCAIGEDGESCYAFTGDTRRAIAAVRRYVREICFATVVKIQVYEPKYVQVFDGRNDYVWTTMPCATDALNAQPVIEIEASY